jgi:hypothetical protein
MHERKPARKFPGPERPVKVQSRVYGCGPRYVDLHLGPMPEPLSSKSGQERGIKIGRQNPATNGRLHEI